MRDVTVSAGEIAGEAGRFLREQEGRRDLLVRQKGSSYDFVTEADTGAQRLIKERVAAMFPADLVIGEEDGMEDRRIGRIIREAPVNQRIWLVDPLDGTINFIRGLGGYGVSIGVFQGGEAIVGAICLPETGEMYLAEAGAGCTRNGVPQHLRPCHRLTDAMVVTGIPVGNPPLRERLNRILDRVVLSTLNVRMLGSAARQQCKLASGAFDIYYEYGPHPWDLAAGELMVREAGGEVCRLDGAPYDLGFGGVLECAPELREPFLQLLRETDGRLSELGCDA